MKSKLWVPQSVTVSGFTTLIDFQNGEYFVPLYSTVFYSLIQGLNYRNIILFGKPYLRLYGLCPPEVSKMFLWPTKQFLYELKSPIETVLMII